MTTLVDRIDRSGGGGPGSVIVIGDDPVSDRTVRGLDHGWETVFIGVERTTVDGADEQTQLSIDSDWITDLNRIVADTAPRTAIIGTSRDSLNLLIAAHLQHTSHIERIVVRVNDPGNVEAFADCSVEIVDAADIVGSALVETLVRTSEPP